MSRAKRNHIPYTPFIGLSVPPKIWLFMTTKKMNLTDGTKRSKMHKYPIGTLVSVEMGNNGLKIGVVTNQGRMGEKVYEVKWCNNGYTEWFAEREFEARIYSMNVLC